MVRAILEIIKIGIQQYGALFAVVGFVCFILWYVLSHVMRHADKREDEQRVIITKQIKELSLQRRQRHKDHTQMLVSQKEIIATLGRINGYKKHR